MSADRDLFNRRELRQSLGTRTNRRRNTKSGVKQTRWNPETKRHETRHFQRERPAARLNQLIAKIKQEGN